MALSNSYVTQFQRVSLDIPSPRSSAAPVPSFGGMSVAKQQLGELLEIWKSTRGSNEPIQAPLGGSPGFAQSPPTGIRCVMDVTLW